MKYAIVFFLLISFYPLGADSRYPYKRAEQRKRPLKSKESLKIEELLLQLENQIEKYTNSLMLVLLSEDTPQVNKIEIIKEIQSLSDKNEKIKRALISISQKGIEQKEAAGEAVRDENISVWAAAQSELLKRSQSEADDLVRRLRALTTDFYIDLAFNGAIIFVGGALFFIPAGQGASIVLTAGRLSLTAKKLGVLLASMGFLEVAIDTGYFVSEKEQKVVSFVSSFVIASPFARELLTLLSSTDENDRYLAKNLFQSPTSENLIRELVGAIGDDMYSITARESLISALKGFPDMEEDIRREAIKVLTHIIDNSGIPDLRQTSVSVLGNLGEGMDEVAEYLREKGEHEDENDKLRLLALAQLGGNQEYFLSSIEALTDWFEGIGYTFAPLGAPLEIPNAFIKALLPEKEESLSEERLKSHKIVVQEFIRLDILDIGLKFRLSKALIRWDNSPANKAFLRKVWANPAIDIRLYVKQLAEESLSEENYQAFEFLQTRLSGLSGSALGAQKALLRTEALVDRFDETYPYQEEISGKLRVFIESYKKMRENIKN